MLELLIGTAYAQDGAAPPAGQGGQILLMVAIFIGIWYWLIIRPQNKQAERHRDMLGALKKGDAVVTGSGLHGRISSMDETTVQLEVARGVKITFDKSRIQRTVAPEKAEGGEAKN